MHDVCMCLIIKHTSHLGTKCDARLSNSTGHERIMPEMYMAMPGKTIQNDKEANLPLKSLFLCYYHKHRIARISTRYFVDISVAQSAKHKTGGKRSSVRAFKRSSGRAVERSRGQRSSVRAGERSSGEAFERSSVQALQRSNAPTPERSSASRCGLASCAASASGRH